MVEEPENLQEFVDKLPPVDIDDLHGLDVAQLKVIFEETMKKFRDLLHVYRFESKKCLDFVNESEDLNKELNEREERLQEREKRLEDGRFLSEYREEQISVAQEVYRVEIAPTEDPIDYVPVVQIQTKKTPKRDETIDDGLVTKRIMGNTEAVNSLMKNIEILRKLIVHYEKRIEEVRETLKLVEENLQVVREQEHHLVAKEEDIAQREREVISQSVNKSFVGA